MDFAHFLLSYTPLNTTVFGCCIAVVPNNVALGEKIKRTLDESVTVKGDSNATVATVATTLSSSYMLDS